VFLGAWRGALVAVKKLRLEASVLAVAGVPSDVAGGSGGSNGSGSGSGSKGASVAAEQMSLFLQEASLHEQLGNHRKLVSLLLDADALPSSSSVASTASAFVVPPVSVRAMCAS